MHINLFQTSRFILKVFSLFALVLATCLGCSNGEPTSEEMEYQPADNSTIAVVDFNSLEPLLYTDEDKTYMINFWAMWCAPCVKEMPYLQEYAQRHPEIELIFVSMDFAEDIETKLKPFLEKKKITSKVILLDDPDSNTWIDKIDPNWSGAIPFTIVFNNKKRAYFERSFEDVAALESEMNNFYKP